MQEAQQARAVLVAQPLNVRRSKLDAHAAAMGGQQQQQQQCQSHPLQAELAQLQYQPWQLAVNEPHPPKVGLPFGCICDVPKAPLIHSPATLHAMAKALIAAEVKSATVNLRTQLQLFSLNPAGHGQHSIGVCVCARRSCATAARLSS